MELFIIKLFKPFTLDLNKDNIIFREPMKISGLNKWIIPRLFSIEDIVALCFFLSITWQTHTHIHNYTRHTILIHEYVS